MDRRSTDFLSVRLGMYGFSADDLFAVPFVLVGVGMMFSPWLAYRAAQLTVYAVTDRRILIIRGAGTKGQKVEAYDDRFVNMLERIDHSDGTGHVIFYHTHKGPNGGIGFLVTLLGS